jgi:hypothetical protein
MVGVNRTEESVLRDTAERGDLNCAAARFEQDLVAREAELEGEFVTALAPAENKGEPDVTLATPPEADGSMTFPVVLWVRSTVGGITGFTIIAGGRNGVVNFLCNIFWNAAVGRLIAGSG